MKKSIKNLKKKLNRKSKYINLLDASIAYPEKKFVIYTRGRTGSTVLCDLLNCHPDIFCDVEIFNFIYAKSKVAFPLKYIQNCSKRADLNGKSVYGFKVKIAQLRIEHEYKNYDKILLKLHEEGWKFIHLKRKNHLKHKLSNILASETNIYHIRGNDSENGKKVNVDCDLLMASIKYSEEIETTEETNLRTIPHLKIIYEDDISESSKHQETANKVFRFLGLKEHPVKTDYKKVLPQDLKNILNNYDEVYNYFKGTKYSEFLK